MPPLTSSCPFWRLIVIIPFQLSWISQLVFRWADSPLLSCLCPLCHGASSTYSCEIQWHSFSNNRSYYLLFLWLWHNTPTKATQGRNGFFWHIAQGSVHHGGTVAATGAWSSCSHASIHGQEREQQMFSSVQPAFCTLHGLGPPAEGLVSCTLMWVFWHQALQPR